VLKAMRNVSTSGLLTVERDATYEGCFGYKILRFYPDNFIRS
jgi:hypothetical protein